MLALGVFALAGVFGIHVPVGATVGPTVFPIFVSVVLLGSAVAVLIGVLRGQRADLEDSEDIDPDAKTDWLTLAKIVGALLAHRCSSTSSAGRRRLPRCSASSPGRSVPAGGGSASSSGS